MTTARGLMLRLPGTPGARPAPQKRLGGREHATRTGFSILDDLTGGLFPGQHWVLTGAPGHGVTLLLTQLAATLIAAPQHCGDADSPPPWHVRLHTPRASPAEVAMRLVATKAQVSMNALRSPRDGDTEATGSDAEVEERAREASAAISRADVLTAAGHLIPLPDPDEVRELIHAGHRVAILVDDADLMDEGAGPQGNDPGGPMQLRRLAAAGALVIAGLPRHRVVDGPDGDSDLNSTWARWADLVLEVRSRGLVPGHPYAREGEAELRVLRHRHGPTTTITTSYRPHYNQIRDVRTPPLPAPAESERGPGHDLQA